MGSPIALRGEREPDGCLLTVIAGFVIYLPVGYEKCLRDMREQTRRWEIGR